MSKHWVLIAIFSLGLDNTNFAQTKNEPVGERTAEIISKIDASAAEEFQKAWFASHNGSDGFEALVLVYRAQDGSILARSHGKRGCERGRERGRVTFAWTDDIIAVVHTHPNGDDPKPSRNDWGIAERFQVPVFTITRRGMYVYDPETGTISKVQQGLDWLTSAKWTHDRQRVAQK